MTATVARYSRKAALAAEPQWSDYQKAIFDWVENGSGNLQIGAVAGSGKTTVLTGIVNRIPSGDRISVLAFNVHIVETLRKRMPSRVTVTTAHAMGFSILTRYFQGARVEVDEGKYRKIMRDLVSQVDLSQVQLSDKYAGKSDKQVQRLVTAYGVDLIRFCQSTLTEPTKENLEHLADYYALDTCPAAAQVMRLVPKALQQGEAIAASQNIIDFGDQLWLIHKWDLLPSERDWVLVDEVQDANPAQLSLYKKLARSGRAIFVGDERQAIMGFSGADPAMWRRIHTEMQTQILPLSVCYRCPSGHIDLARSIVPQIQAKEGAIAGELGVVHPGQIKEIAQPGDLVVCRFTAPLISLCLRFIVAGIEARVRGREIGAAMVNLAREIGEPFHAFETNLANYCLPQILQMRDQDLGQQADTLEDRYLAVKACHEQFGEKCDRLNDFCDRISNLFVEQEAPITLSTIHRAKGDEAENVFLLGCNNLPWIKRAKHDWQIEQEMNLAYVALTRAKKKLYLVPLVRDNGKKDSLELDDFLSMPYGGMDIEPVEYDEKKAIAASTVARKDERGWMPAIGDKVHKRFHLGWVGRVKHVTDPQTVEVLWTLDQYPSRMSVWDLRSEFEQFESKGES